MRIPDLPPDIRFRRMECEDEGEALVIKKAALGPHIAVRWPWDDTVQAVLHHRHFAARDVHAIVRCDEMVGTVCVQDLGDRLSLDEFFVLPQWQRQGIGSKVLRHCLALADEAGLPVRLQHLRWNQVGALYLRHGFAETGSDGTHIFMERPVQHARGG